MDTSSDNPPGQPVKEMRWVGLLMVVCGGALAYFSIVSPLLEASQHEPDVSISPKQVVLAHGLLVVGFILFFLGNQRAGQLFGTRQKKSVLGWVICLATAGVGILVSEWLKSRLRAYGYNV